MEYACHACLSVVFRASAQLERTKGSWQVERKREKVSASCFRSSAPSPSCRPQLRRLRRQPHARVPGALASSRDANGFAQVKVTLADRLRGPCIHRILQILLLSSGSVLVCSHAITVDRLLLLWASPTTSSCRHEANAWVLIAPEANTGSERLKKRMSAFEAHQPAPRSRT